MRAKIAAAFALGFALGMLCLGVVLWRSGQIRAFAANGAVPDWQKPMVPMDADLKDMLSQAKNVPPPVVGPPPPPLTGAADREAPAVSLPTANVSNPIHLAMPLAGIDPKTLTEAFYDKRDGHPHEAIDIPAARGTPVLAVTEGNVTKLYNSKEGGITVYQFDNAQTYCYYYAHLDRYAPSLKEGTLLRKGDVLGYVGNTGNASAGAPHLHFAVFRLGPEKKWWEGTAIDPLPLLQ